MVRTAGPIVVGVKEHQPWVLDRAKAEAERAGRPLRLVHAFTVPPTLVGVAFLDVPAAMRATSEQLLESASQRLREGGRTVPIERAVVRGAPGWVLEQESKHAELLVIGPDDAKHWWSRLVEGRVTKHLLHTAICPVLVVPQSPGPSGRHVVVIVEGSSGWDLVGRAADEAEARGLPLHVVHRAGEADQEITARHDREQGVGRARARHPDLVITSEVIRGSAPGRTRGALEHCELLVIGYGSDRHRASALGRAVADGLVDEEACPVLALPAPSARDRRRATG